jgi:hypothetical protein
MEMKPFILLTAMLLAAPGALNAADAPETKPGKPMLFSAYYIWYETGRNPANGKPWRPWLKDEKSNAGPDGPNAEQIASTAWPLIGLYNSRDPVVIDWHVRLAMAAGLDAFLVSWFGEERMFTSFDLLLEKAEAHGFKVARLDELAQFQPNWERYKAEIVAFLKKYAKHPAYLKIDGRPVVYLYQTTPGRLTPAQFTELKAHVEERCGLMYWIMDKIAHDHEAQKRGDQDRIKCIPAEWLKTPGIDSLGFYSTFSHFRANTYEELAGKYAYLAQLAHRAGKKMLLPVHPGHDNSRFNQTPYVMERRDGKTLKDFLKAATDAQADFVMVTSWNEWPETTIVEPSSTWPDPYQYLKILAEWKGVTFVPPAAPQTRPGSPK